MMPDFPLIPQTYYSHPSIGGFPPDFPCVLKVGSSSQGVGKARIQDVEQWKDSLSLMSMTTEYFVTEPFVQWQGDVRIQKIGNHYRAIKRVKTSSQSSWKANDPMGISEEDVKVEERWKRWIDVASLELMMPICGMDLLITVDNKEYILEVNSSSIGFPSRHAREDCGHICELLISTMSETFCAQSSTKPRIQSLPIEPTSLHQVDKHIAPKTTPELLPKKENKTSETLETKDVLNHNAVTAYSGSQKFAFIAFFMCSISIIVKVLS